MGKPTYYGRTIGRFLGSGTGPLIMCSSPPANAFALCARFRMASTDRWKAATWSSVA